MRRHTCSVFKKWLLFLLVVVSSLALLFYNQPSLLSRPMRTRRNPCSNAHWIILTKANLTGNMTCVATTSGWTILIPSDVELEGYEKMVIRPDTVADMDESLLVRDPSRINIPLYVAIRYGAHLIYRVKDLNSVLPNLETHFSEPFEHHLEATGNGMFNPYRHFGQPSIRPRGHPLSLGDQANIRYSISSEVSPHVIQVVNSRQLVIENPSEATSGQSVNVTLDASTTPVYFTSGKGRTVTLDARAPPVYLTSGLWAPVNVMNTLFLNQSLWAAVWPVSMSPPEADVIHGYWMQRLLWENGGRMGFLAFDAGIHTVRASQSSSSKPANKTVAELLSFLEKWECESGFTFFRCAEDISDRMAESGFWTKTDSAFVKSWLDFLRDRGYSEPSRKPTHMAFTPKLKQFSEPNQKPPFTPETPKLNHSLLYEPAELTDPLQSSSTPLTELMSSLCPKSPITLHYNDLVHVQKQDMVLVVTFNSPFYANVPYLELFYGTVFRHIVYCGPDAHRFTKVVSQYSLRLSFIEVAATTGILIYRCLSTAMKMNFKTLGYMCASDDVLFNSWNLRKLPADKAWLNGVEPMDRYQNSSNWMWWQRPSGKRALTNAWDDLHRLETDTRYKKIIGNFKETLEKNTGSSSGFVIGGSDIVYVPRQLVRKAIFFLDLFVKNGVFLEIALPTIISGLVPKSDIFFMKGEYFWYDGKRDRIPELFNPNDTFLHPIKLSEIKGKWNKFVCGVVFPLIYKKKI